MARIVPATPETIAEAARMIQDGGLVAFPTETVYGLGANALDAEAVAKIFAAKGRPATNPVIVHIAAANDLGRVAQGKVPHKLASHFWPGPLTLVLPKHPRVPDSVTAGGPTVAVRVPRHPVALALIQAAGVPLAAPSANRSEALSPTLARHIAESLGDAIDLILDGGPCEVGLESTVLDVTVWPPRILRPGMTTREEIEAVLGLHLAEGVTENGTVARSPGQMLRHYAPRTPLRLSANPWQEAEQSGKCVAVLGGKPPIAEDNLWGAMPGDPRAYAAALYAALHELDHSGADLILVACVPETPEWDAVRDRLRRAASYV